MVNAYETPSMDKVYDLELQMVCKETRVRGDSGRFEGPNTKSYSKEISFFR